MTIQKLGEGKQNMLIQSHIRHTHVFGSISDIREPAVTAPTVNKGINYFRFEFERANECCFLLLKIDLWSKLEERRTSRHLAVGT